MGSHNVRQPGVVHHHRYSRDTLLCGLKNPLTVPLIIIRTLAYILVIVALWLYLRENQIFKETRQGWIDYFKSDITEPETKEENG